MSHDHQEIDLSLIAGVTDRGLRHRQNEDAMELAVVPAADGPVLVAVVCDGVSTSIRPAEASLAAAQAAEEVLRTAAQDGTDLAEASSAAVRSAEDAVASLAQSPGGVGSATFVSAVITSSAATLCWLGDSRAYWLGAPGTPAPASPAPGSPGLESPAPASPDPGSPDPGSPAPGSPAPESPAPETAQRLTRDDSLAEEMVAAGLLPEDEALSSPHAHVVTRWVGADPGEATPHVVTFDPPGPGVLMLCSDGLWNYQPDAGKLAELALPTALTDPLAAAQALVTFAIEAGGRDNITVILAPFPPGP
jgi:serine/threonine protein phosphatase PrpC